MKPNEVLDCELWMINDFLKGCRERYIREQENIIKVSYNTASFTNSKHKPKKLSFYLKELRKGEKDVGYLKQQLEEDKKNVSRLEKYWKNKEMNEDGNR